MPDLQSCYFCATPDDVQEYAVIPPRFAPDEDDQRSVALCEECKTKLLRTIEPLTDRLDEATDEQAPSVRDRDADAAASATGPSDESATLDGDAGGGDGITMATGRADDGDSTAADDEAGDAAGDAGEEAAAGDGPAAGDDAEAETADGDARSDSGADGSPPPNYRRAMRMLSNREFPVERREVESMLAGAYDLESHEIEAVLEHAVESDRLVEEDGRLRQA